MDAKAWFIAGTLPLIAGGGLHAAAIALDTVRLTFFAPLDPATRPAMEDSGLRLVQLLGGGDRPRPSVWSVWMGIHYSHGLGICAFGLLCLLLATHDYALVEQIGAVRVLALVFSAALFAVAMRFWFYGPRLITGSSAICFALAFA